MSVVVTLPNNPRGGTTISITVSGLARQPRDSDIVVRIDGQGVAVDAEWSDARGTLTLRIPTAAGQRKLFGVIDRGNGVSTVVSTAIRR